MAVDGEALLAALLDAWDRNNRITVNLLRAVPAAGFGARVMPESPTVLAMLTHLLYVRLIFVSEDAPEFGGDEPRKWLQETDPERIAAGLDASARVVREVVAAYVHSGKALARHYDHPVLLLEHMIWHEGYHQGQIKLALKRAGLGLADEAIGPGTWGVWMRKTG